jgi:hypothetical protein
MDVINKFYKFCPQWLFIFISQRIYTVSPQREPSRILPSVTLHFYPSEDLYHVYSEKTFTDFALSGSFHFHPLVDLYRVYLERTFMSFAFTSFLFIPQWIYTMSLHRELSWILPLVALYFHPLVDLHRVSLERIFTGFALSGFIFSSLSGFTPFLLKENFHQFFPQWLCIFILQWIYTVSPQRELPRVLP